MVSRGVTRTGDVYCMSCGEYVAAGASQCPACDSILEDEVKAFRCPRCERINEFGIPECSGCGMRFKVKALKLEGPSEEGIVRELLDEGTSERVQEEAPTQDAGAAESDVDGDADPEDQLSKREALVDRKIKGYASKMKDLIAREQDLEARMAEFDRRVEEAETTPGPTSSAEAEESARLVEAVTMATGRVRSLLARIDANLPVESGEVGFEQLMDALDEAVGGVVDDRTRLEGRLREEAENEDDLRRLMKALDQLLEQLPEAAVTEFAETEEYKLYEQVLDRLKL